LNVAPQVIGAWHVPPPQNWPLAQGCPQSPQLRLSLVMSMQPDVPHAFCPVGQVQPLAPHVCPGAQTLPQPPQLLRSVA
jgi:hypothetical protein